VRVPDCYSCTATICDFPIGDKHWA
jgi:hypothetical protein